MRRIDQKRYLSARVIAVSGVLALAFGATPIAFADQQPQPPKTAFVNDVFGGNGAPNSMFGNVNVNDITYLPSSPESNPKSEGGEPKKEPSPSTKEEKAEKASEQKVAEDKKAVADEKLMTGKYEGAKRDKDGVLPIRAELDAHPDIKGLTEALNSDDWSAAQQHATQFARYIKKFMLRMRQMMFLVGQAMVEEGMIPEEEWANSQQYLQMFLADVYSPENFPMGPTHNDTLELVKADPKHEAQIYYFFTINSSYSRLMASEIERLWRVAKSDSRLKMAALTMGPESKFMVDEYRKYTGLTVPIYEGKKMADKFNIRFVPAVVVVTPNTGSAYVTTGQQNFKDLYEIVRSAQGLPRELSDEATQLISQPIGKVELMEARSGEFQKKLVQKGLPKDNQQKSSGPVVVPAGNKIQGVQDATTLTRF